LSTNQKLSGGEKEAVTFDCVALANSLQANVSGPTNSLYKSSQAKKFNWKALASLRDLKAANEVLPVGSLIVTGNHLTIVVGFLEKSEGVDVMIIEAENFLAGVVRAKIERVESAGFDKNSRVVFPRPGGFTRLRC
jgi:hypothetical protein